MQVKLVNECLLSHLLYYCVLPLESSLEIRNVASYLESDAPWKTICTVSCGLFFLLPLSRLASASSRPPPSAVMKAPCGVHCHSDAPVIPTKIAFLSSWPHLKAASNKNPAFAPPFRCRNRPHNLPLRSQRRTLRITIKLSSEHDDINTSATTNKKIGISLEATSNPSSTTSSPQIGFFGRSLRRLLSGFEPTPELGAILSAYFVQGALGISRLAVSFFLKDELSLSPAQMSAIMGVAVTPWLIKPLYGFLSDSLPLFGSRRRAYLLIAATIGVASWFSLGTVVDSIFPATVAIIGTSMSVAVSDVVVDSIVVERVRPLPMSRSASLQSLCWSTSAIGGLLSAYFSGSLLQTLSPRTVFVLTALLPASTTILATFIKEPHVSLRRSEIVQTFRDRASRLWEALRNPSVILPTIFVFLWQATPSPDSAMFYFQTNVLNFGPEFLGLVRLISSMSALTGLWAYNTFWKAIPLKTLMRNATLLSVPLSLTQLVLVTRANVPLGLSDRAFALVDGAVLTALGQVTFMPTLVLAAQMCPPGVEGSLFAALMSVYNASGVTSSELGALLTSALGVTDSNFDRLWLLVTLCSLSYLLPLPFLRFVDRAPPEVPEEPTTEPLNAPTSEIAHRHD